MERAPFTSKVDDFDETDLPPSKISRPLKYCLFAFTSFFWLIGGAFVGIGAWVVLQKKGYEEVSDFTTDPAIIIIAVGVCIFIVSFCGSVGALRENICLLTTYKICLVLVLLLELIGGILAFSFWPETKRLLNNKVQTSIKKYTSNQDLRNLIDRIQYEFKCCGSTNTDDWDWNPYYSCGATTIQSCGVPWSCCLRKFQRNKQCGYGQRRNRLRLKMGEQLQLDTCMDVLIKFFKDNLAAVAGAAVAFSLPLLMGVILSHILINQIKDQIAMWTDPKAHF
ncbi:tetraspanin-33-like [Rhopilema esculentum]|uniref:tetraspanin-33-like n=1 Tax=Rhopilema esculentum TaxID=499914 RepID=UPI0031D44C8A|eukprot:gene5352-528_t